MAGYILICFVITSQVTLSLCGLHSWPKPVTKPPEEVFKDWRSLESNARTLVDQVMKQLMPYFIRISSEIDISPDCSASMLKLVLDLRNFKEWAIRMVDASGKPGGGQLYGSVSALGSYNECLDIVLPDSVYSSSETSPRGMYCVVDLKPILPPKPKLLIGANVIEPLRNYTSSLEIIEKMKKYLGLTYLLGFKLGVCVPSTCGLKDMQEVARYVTENVKLDARIRSCEVKEKLKIETDQFIVIGILGFFAVLTVSATVVQACLRSKSKRNTSCHEVADSFSLVSNLQRVFKTSNKPGQDTTLSCLSGMRFISMTWVVLGHTNLVTDFNVARDSILYVDRLKGFFFQAVLNGTLSVDTFLFITAVLVAYNLVSMTVNEKKNVSVVALILKRIWRLLPSALLTASLTIVIPLIASGPSWNDYVLEERDVCRKNWWQLALFINNLVHPLDMCLPHSWYISLDMQLFLVALLFIFINKKYPKLSFPLLCGLTMAGIISATAVAWFLEITPTFIPLVYDIDMATRYGRYGYFMPHCHLAVYAIGLGLGTILSKKKKLNMSVRMRTVGWLLAVTTNMSVLFISVIWNSGDQYPLGLFPSLYGGLHRPLWALGLAWTTLMCAKGYGGLVNKFLSWTAFTPLNRLTYLVYLTHLIVIMYYQASLSGEVESTQTAVVWLFLGNLLVSFILSLILKLLYEAPLLNIENRLLPQLFRKRNSAAHTEKSHSQPHNPQDVKICPEAFTHL